MSPDRRADRRFAPLVRLLAFAAALLPAAAQAEPPHHPRNIDQPPQQAEINETVERVPVSVVLLDGRTRSGDMVLTHYRPAGAGPFPAIVIQHGRASNRRTLPWRWRMVGLARFWTKRGFAVVVPTRLGYGETGLHPDPELVGRCDDPNLKPLVEALVTQTRTAVDWARRQPWVDPARVLLMGQSLGGLASMATNAARLPGVVGVINFAGGYGGRPDRLHQPCTPERLEAAFREMGATAASPSIWIYAENDQLWGAALPRGWHRAYAQGGAVAEFHMLPPVGEEGHDFQAKGLRYWRPLVDDFVSRLGFPVPATPKAPPSSGFAELLDGDRVPQAGERGRGGGYQRFLDADVPRAFVIAPNGSWAMASGEDALARAMERCRQSARQACRPYAIDDRVVWTPAR